MILLQLSIIRDIHGLLKKCLFGQEIFFLLMWWLFLRKIFLAMCLLCSSYLSKATSRLRSIYIIIMHVFKNFVCFEVFSRYWLLYLDCSLKRHFHARWAGRCYRYWTMGIATACQGQYSKQPLMRSQNGLFFFTSQVLSSCVFIHKTSAPFQLNLVIVHY